MKYNINKELAKCRYLKPSLNKMILKMAKTALSIYPKSILFSKSVSIEKQKLYDSDNKKKIPIYIIRPQGNHENSPVMLYLHGGAFVFKGAPYHYKLLKEYALNSGYTIVFVDYSLAFDSPFCASLHDSLVTYRYILNAHDSFNDKKICLAGDSAGGYLCLCLIEQCKNQGLLLPDKLIYPVVDPEMSLPTMQKYTDTPLWNSKLNAKMWTIYSKGNEIYNPLYSDLGGFPKTYIETAEFDCLHDEGILLYRKFSDSNVECFLNETRGMVHGFDICLKASVTKSAIEKRIAFLQI